VVGAGCGCVVVVASVGGVAVGRGCVVGVGRGCIVGVGRGCVGWL
jgi:hypothetical protein